jgi:hypothetical protein
MPIPRRLGYVVDRRAVVDQATSEAEKLRAALEADARHLNPRLRMGQVSGVAYHGAVVSRRRDTERFVDGV